MKKFLTFVLAGLLMTSTACSTKYLKPDTTRQDFDRDYETCYWQAREAGPSRTLVVLSRLFFSPAAVVMDSKQVDRTHDCMRSLGYTVGNNSTGYGKYDHYDPIWK